MNVKKKKVIPRVRHTSRRRAREKKKQERERTPSTCVGIVYGGIDVAQVYFSHEPVDLCGSKNMKTRWKQIRTQKNTKTQKMTKSVRKS